MRAGCSTNRGPGASNQFESCGFIRSRAGVDYPDIQFHFLPIAVRYDGKAAAEGHGFQAHVGPMRSASRGAVTLRSADPMDDPVIRFNYMSEASDWEEFRTCIRLTREVFEQEAFKPYLSHEIQPGPDAQSDDALDDFIREHAESAYHPCGTCRIGRADDRTAVVDPETQVIGVEGLRVADSSVFPRIHQRQSECTLDHGRREGQRSHPGPRPAGCRQCRALGAFQLADGAAIGAVFGARHCGVRFKACLF